MATPKPVEIQWEQENHTLEGGHPTGNIIFMPIPELTYVAISDAAAKRGMTAAQAIAQAISEFLSKPLP